MLPIRRALAMGEKQWSAMQLQLRRHVEALWRRTRRLEAGAARQADLLEDQAARLRAVELAVLATLDRAQAVERRQDGQAAQLEEIDRKQLVTSARLRAGGRAIAGDVV